MLRSFIRENPLQIITFVWSFNMNNSSVLVAIKSKLFIALYVILMASFFCAFAFEKHKDVNNMRIINFDNFIAILFKCKRMKLSFIVLV